MLYTETKVIIKRLRHSRTKQIHLKCDYYFSYTKFLNLITNVFVKISRKLLTDVVVASFYKKGVGMNIARKVE